MKRNRFGSGDGPWRQSTVRAPWRGPILGSNFVATILVLALLGPLPAPASTNDHVVVISIDGLAAFYWSDAQAPLPTLRKLAAQGAVAKALRESNPTTTWPNHATLVTGVSPAKHSVLGNGLVVREGPGRPVRIDPLRNQDELVAVPAIYDCLHRAGYRTAAINWPCTRGATNLDDNFPDAPDGVAQTTPRLRAELIHAGILGQAGDASFQRTSAAAADQAWTAAAVHLLHVRPPNLLLLHLLVTDTLQHRYGPQSPAAYAALGLADAHVAEVLRALDRTGLRDRTTLFIVSDHGFERPSRLINPNVILRKAGMLRPAPRRRAQSLSEGGTAFVYLTNPETAQADRAKVKALLSGVEGIAAIMEPDGYAALRLPDPAQNPRMGDLLLAAKEGYSFSDESFEDEPVTPLPMSLGSHGYLADDPRMDGVFIAWGRGIKPGTALGRVDNRDVAPTIAALLGEKLNGAEGRARAEMLDATGR